MNNYKKVNNIVGWLVFAIALVVYVVTAEPTASWWDCMEFTATSYKLEVGHPPGAPLFMMLMRLFTLLSFGDPSAVGFASNLMSCTASAFCILFMFWTITRLARKMHTDDWTAIGAGIIGALAYAFTDTFWFSAVESEVYATSSMFTALVVWLMLRWEEVADEPDSSRWLVLIAYMMGLSIGVHILNLLALPALVLIFYFRKTSAVTLKGAVLALLASGGILLAIYKILMPFPVAVGAWVDRMFVNGLGLPVNSGMVAWVLVLFALVGAGIWFTHRRGHKVWNTILLCIGVIFIGYSSYASVVIRASVNPPMNSNRPDNPYALRSLMGREQYGSIPIVYGPRYDSKIVDTKYSKTWFLSESGKYESREVLTDYVFAPGSEVLFPRQWDYASADKYKEWGGGNLSFFFGYQFNFMYWRYFLWNFVGRQDDIQGRGDIVHGNWLSGIGPIDALYLGPQSDLPDEIARNKGRNKLFFLPFLLGILGLISQLGRDRRGFVVVISIFLMMGVALVVYFNSPPGAVRERDYIYAGSFYAFSIWIGLGVAWVQEVVSRWFKGERASGAHKISALTATAICVVVPVLLLAQEWDDHDRSGRSIGHDIGYNFMISALPNSIFMNFGDNDTFPLWYNQEVENVRPDVRIMNTSYLGADWYIDQMRHAYNASAPVPLSIPPSVYRDNDAFIYVEPVIDRALTVDFVLDFISSRDPKTRVDTGDGHTVDYIPTTRLALPVDKEAALRSGIVRPEDAAAMVDTIYFNIPERSLRKDQLALLDVLGSFDWERPLYFTMTQTMREMGLGDYLQADGWAYRFVPIQTKYDVLDTGRIDTQIAWRLLMEEYRYGGSGAPGVYIDYNSLINLQFVGAQYSFVRLANALLDEGDFVRAEAALDRSLVEYPASKLDYDFWNTYSLIEAYYAVGAASGEGSVGEDAATAVPVASATAKADALLEDYSNTLQQYIEYYLRFPDSKQPLVEDVWYAKLRDLSSLAQVAEFYGRTAQTSAIDSYLDQFAPSEE